MLVGKKVIIASNTSWSLVNFRSGLIRALTEAGYEVVAAAPQDDHTVRLPSLGCRFVALPMDNKGTNPLRDLLLLVRFHRLLRHERPAVLLGYTVKPNVYGSMAAHMLGIPVINNIAGLGTAFVRESWVTHVVGRLYRLALAHSYAVFFQNGEDLRLFLDLGIVHRSKISRLPGSGVDTQAFIPALLPSTGGEDCVFLLMARLLWDKGVGEYVKAARRLRERHPTARFLLLGPVGVANRSAISQEQILLWQKEGVIEYLGHTDDVRSHISTVDCVVLPSYYREGVPRSLLEAAAMGRPIVTTDAPGCRDVVEDGVTGFLCQPRDAEDLAEKMEQIIKMTPEERSQMGLCGRQKVEREFDEKIVIGRYLNVLEEIVPRQQKPLPRE